jgi:hypothetical protein
MLRFNGHCSRELSKTKFDAQNTEMEHFLGFWNKKIILMQIPLNVNE